MTTIEAEYAPFIYAPPSFDLDYYLEKLNSPLLEHAHYRRLMCQADPLLFALIYLEHHLISEETGGKDIHLSQMHIDIAKRAEQLVRHDFLPAEVRECTIGPRDSGKSTWIAQPIIPLWAAAFKHKELICGFTANDPAAVRFMDCIRTELSDNWRLRHDFPDLCTPARNRNNRTRADTQNVYTARNGVTIMAYGIDSNQLGAKIQNTRPKLIILDDIEPDEGNYSIERKESRLATLRQAVLPMNDRAVVLWVGTTTMFDSMVHDLVRTALGQPVEWVVEDEWKAYYYPPIVRFPDGTEESMWAAKWPLNYLKKMLGRRIFSINFENNPRSVEHGLWTPADIQVVENAPMAAQVLGLDPAVTSTQRSDPTGLAVLTWGARLVVEYAEELTLAPGDLKDLTLRMLDGNPMIDRIVVETNQGGEHWGDMLWPVLPSGITLIEVHTSVGKRARFAHLLDFYQRDPRRIVHADDFPALTRQMLTFPKLKHDDIIDAVCLAAEEHLGHEWSPNRARSVVRRRTK